MATLDLTASVFGSGDDGDHTVSGTETLTTDKYYRNLTIPASTTLKTNGYRLFVAGKLQLDGTLHNNGAAGASGNQSTGGSGGVATAGTVGGGTDGTSGPTGTTGAGSSSSSPTAAVGLGGGGGTSGAGGSGFGGNGGAATSGVATTPRILEYPTPLVFQNSKLLEGGTGGSGGASGGGDSQTPGAGAGGGGGGAGGGVLFVFAAGIEVSATGKIQANGGSGGNGGTVTTCIEPIGGGGGAGGGGGGFAYILYDAIKLDAAATLEAVGGAGGAKGNGCIGVDGTAGAQGGAGAIIKLQRTGIINAADFGILPDGSDVTDQLKMIFTVDGGVAKGSTVFFGPGTYKVSEALEISNPINVSAYGAVFDFEDTTFATGEAALTWGNTSSVLANSEHFKLSFRGLTVLRNGASALNLMEGIGFTWFRLVQCDIANCSALNFSTGHFIIGNENIAPKGSGCVRNNFSNLSTFDCKFGIVLRNEFKINDQKSFTNENNFFGGRLQVGSLKKDALSGRAISIELEAGATIPNNNRFYGVSMEGNWGRKIFCQGQDNYWLFCRYEGQPVEGGVVSVAVAAGGDGFTTAGGTVTASVNDFKGNYTTIGPPQFPNVAEIIVTDSGKDYTPTSLPVLTYLPAGTTDPTLVYTLGDGYTIEFNGSSAKQNFLLWGNQLDSNKVLNSNGATGNQKLDNKAVIFTDQTNLNSVKMLRQGQGSSTRVTSSEVIVGITAPPATVRLRTADLVSGRILTVKDESGDADNDTKTITVDTEGSETIDGQSDIKIGTAFGYVQLYGVTGGEWHIIGSKLT